jgi:hypothetical protein
MTRLARALCSLHGALGIWLAYCAVQSYRHGVLWIALVFAAGSLVPVISVIRETELADEQREAAIHAEYEARAPARAEERAAARARAACCVIWIVTDGHDHEDDCPKNDHRSAA